MRRVVSRGQSNALLAASVPTREKTLGGGEWEVREGIAPL